MTQLRGTKLRRILLGRILLGAVPTRCVDWEPLLVRVCFALILIVEDPIEAGLSRTAAPFANGLAQHLPLWTLSQWSQPLMVGYALALGLYVAGLLLPVATGYLTLILVIAGTLNNSQGAIGHSHQGLALLAAGQFAAYSVGFVQSLWRKRDCLLSTGHRWTMLIAPQLLAYVYVTSAISKFRRSGWEWFTNSTNLAVEVVKTHSQGYYNDLAPGMLERGLSMSHWLLDHQTTTRWIAGSGFVVELLAFAGLFGKRAGLLMALLLASLHGGVNLMMRLDFRANQYCLLLFLGHGAFWLLWTADRALARRRPAELAAAP